MEEPVEQGESSVQPVTRPRARWAYPLLALVLVAVVGGAYWLKTRPEPELSRSATGQPASPDTIMKAGLGAVHGNRDPNAAAAEFRKVLQRNPTHYGATYQLATSLDRAGKRAEARPLWEKVLKMAEGYSDKQAAATARTRLAQN